MKYCQHIVFLILILLLLSCAQNPVVHWEMKKLHDTFCPDGADERACAVVNFEYPRFSGHMADSLNELILRTLCLNLAEDLPCPDIESIAEDFIDEFKSFQQDMPGSSAGWQLDQRLTILSDRPKVLSMAHTFYVFTGGAHGLPGEYFINIEKKSGRVLLLDDVVKNEKQNDVLEMATQKFYEQRDIPSSQTLDDAGYWFENQQFYLPDNFSIRDDGLLFLYNPYEIASYADGMIELFLPFSDIKSFLKMDMLQ